MMISATTILIFCLHVSSAQLSTTYGVHFYIGLWESPWIGFDQYELSMGTLSTEPVHFTVESGTGWNYTGEVSVDNPAIVRLPQSISYSWRQNSYSERYKGIHVHSTMPLSVVVLMTELIHSGQYLAYPYTDLKQQQYEYFIVSAESWGVGGQGSLFLLVGNEDNTTITIAPTQAVEIPTDPQDPNSTLSLITAGNAHTLVLHQMQTLLIESTGGDLTGTAVIADKPLTVISGHTCGTLSNEQWWVDTFLDDNDEGRFLWWSEWGCNYLIEQIPSTVTWGKKFLLVPFPEGVIQHYNKIIASAHETTVTQTCNAYLVQTVYLSSPGDWNFRDWNITYDPQAYCVIKADKPILVTQFSAESYFQTSYLNSTYIHETISIVPPVEQYINTTVYVPLLSLNTSKYDYYQHHYLHITTNSSSTVLLDSVAYNWDWQPINDDIGDTIGYGTIHEFNDTNTHVLHHTDPAAGLSVIAYGSGREFEITHGYVYLTGMKLNVLTKGPLQLNPWYGHILGGVPIILTGPSFFKLYDQIQCRFDNNNPVNGTVVSTTQALCITPRMTATGRVSVQLYQNNIKYHSESSFYSKRIEFDHKVTVESNDLLIHAEETITLTWIATSLTDNIGTIDTSALLIDIKLHIFTNDSIEEVVTLVNNTNNTGSATVTIPTVTHSSSLAVYTAIISIEAKGNNPQYPTPFDKAQGTVMQWTDMIWIVPTTAQKYTNFWSACKEWSVSEPSSIGQELLSKVRSEFPCPPTIDQARTINSGLIQDVNTKQIQFFHPNADKCFRQRTITRETDNAGNQCCYGNNGNLIVGPISGGSVDKISHVGGDGSDYLTNLIGHQYEDLLPYIYCCKGSHIYCDTYFERRPSDNGTAYVPPIPARAIGDPHIFTLDQHKYTFNGKGEFILIETTDQSFSLQGRMIELKDSLGSATVFSACVAKTDVSSTVQFEVHTKDNAISLTCLVNGEKIDFNVLKSQEFANVTISDLGNNSLSATFTSGAFLQAQEENGFMSVISVGLPNSYHGYKTRGLMGIFNDDRSDDLSPRGSTIPLPLNSTLQIIHNDFGITWIIDNPRDSLFFYQFEESWSNFYHPSFTPVYGATFSDASLEEKANEICGNDEFCKFDIAATGRVEIGEATFNGGQNFEQLVNLSQQITCDPPCMHGACVATDVCDCGEGYSGDTCDSIVTTPCSNNPCNGGACQYHAGNYICTCPPALTGIFCEENIPTSTPDNAGLIAGVTIATVLPLIIMVVLTVIVLLMVYLRKREPASTKAKDDNHHEMGNIYLEKSAAVSKN